MPLEFEDSEVRDLGLDCAGRCAFCCLCPPGIVSEEQAVIEKACERVGTDLGEDGIGDSDRAITTQGEWGACIFLKDRRCRIYESRPHFCRQFPLQVYSGWRLQLSAIRSCRGVVELPMAKATRKKGTMDAVRLRDVLDNEIGILGEDYFTETLAETRESFQELEDEMVFAPHGTVLRQTAKVMGSIGDARSMARLLGIHSKGEGEAKGMLMDRYLPDIIDTFDDDDIINLPVFCSEDARWIVYRVDGVSVISEYNLQEAGTLVFEKSAPIEGLGLMELEAGARDVLKAYLDLAFGRDIFYGMVAREAMVEDRPMQDIALDLGAKVATDIWWRAGLLHHFASIDKGRGGKGHQMTIGARPAREAVVFMDADLLDSYALGAII